METMPRNTTTDGNGHRRAVRATLSDVARDAGVSKSTASMVLNRHPQASHYSSDTRLRVAAAARALGYKPNLFARRLRQATNRWLMLCISSFRETFAAEVAHAFEARTAERHCTLVVVALGRQVAAEGFQTEVLDRHGVEAIAIVGEATQRQLPDDVVARIANEGSRIVLINRRLQHANVSCVLVDDAIGQRQMAEHLYAQGVERAAILAGPEHWTLGRRRRQAVEQVAAGLGRPAPHIIHTGATRWDDGYRATQQQLKRFAPDAIFATTDYLAYGALRACAEAGLRVGRDIAVVGFDDIYPSQFTHPPLTTVRLPMDEMGRVGADLLMDALDAPAHEPAERHLPTHIVLRESGTFQRRK
jgi:DNA-binding LacI/PurR family transcriptional regulator